MKKKMLSGSKLDSTDLCSDTALTEIVDLVKV